MVFLKKAICGIIFLLSATIAHADVRFGIAAEPYPPFTLKDASGKWVGWEIDLMNAICKEMHENCSIVEVSWENIIPALSGRLIDVIWSSMGITNERLRVIDFTDVYYTTPSVLIGAKEYENDISPTHLQDKAIAVQTGTMYEAYLAKHFSGSRINTYQTQDEAFQDLIAGRVDYAPADFPAAQAFLKTPEGSACCELKGQLPIDAEIFGPGAAGGIRKGDTELKERINNALRVIKASGEYEKIIKAYSGYGILPQ